MKFKSFIPMLSLQVFAEGAGDGGAAQGQGVTAGAAAQQTKGAKSNPLADVKYGIQEEEAPAAEVQQTTEVQADPEAEFEKLIKGQYKAQYDARMQDTIQKRLKGTKETVDKYNALQPVLEILGKKHGVDASDIAALQKAIEDDDSYFEEEALKQGMSVQQFKEFRKIQQENADLKAQMQEQQSKDNANKLYAGWMNQAEETKKIYPGFDMRTEMANPKFLELLKSNIDVRTAYEVVHKDEIISGAMQFTAKTVESKLAKKIASGGARPAENGMSSGSAAVVKSDPSLWSKEDRKEVARRVARGEKIRL
jgi:hypothetical protein